MNRTNAMTRNVTSATASSLSMSAAHDSVSARENAEETKARRLVNAVATMRVLVPVALITALVMSGRPQEVRIDNAMAAVTQTPAVSTSAPQSYYPAQFVNQGVGGEEHVSNF